VFFAYHNRSKPTGELLAKMLQLPHGIFPSENDTNIRPIMDDTLIRWGSRTDEWVDEHYDKVVNSCEAIKRCSDKLQSLELMDMAGINVPEYSDDPESLIEQFGYPILGRNRHHARGTDIKLVLQKRDLRRQKDYYVRYIPTNREYRIHVVGDEVIRVQGKYLDNSAEQVSHVRNYATGYRFRKPRMRLHSERLSMAVEAVKIHGLDFGAVDLLIGDDGLGYVLEVNTAPSCSPLTLGAYAVALQSRYCPENEIDMSVVDMLDRSIEDADSDDEVEGEEE
jgi:glutathione synthase/RimK-type ligase-like ATP-grasp enzyme